MGNLFTTFTNCRLCINGQLVEGERLVVSQDTGEILKSTGYIGGEIVDLDDAIVAPGFIDICAYPPKNIQHEQWLADVSQKYITSGVTGFYVAAPYSGNQASDKDSLSKAFSKLATTETPSEATLLGIHLNSSSKIENEAEFLATSATSSNIKLATIDIENIDTIGDLSTRGIRVAMSSPTATYSNAESALYAGATAISRPLTTTKPLAADDPGPVGLLALHDRLAPYFFLPCDNKSLHSKSAVLLFRASPQKAILCGQDGAAGEVMVSLDQCVRNVYYWSGCDIALAVKAVTENVASFMGLTDRGRLVEGCRADFVVLDDGGNVKETWIAGHKVWPEGDREGSPDY
jgi:N-acetylglucosamine-6-phosphate deacetylase